MLRYLIGIGIPYLGVIGLLPWVASMDMYVLGVPFIYMWIFVWFALTSGCLLTCSLHISSFSVQLRGSFDKRELKNLLKSLPGTVLRAKGIVRLLGFTGRYACHLAGRRVTLTPCDGEADDMSTLVLIGQFNSAEEAALRAGLARAVRPDEIPVHPVM